MILHTLTVTELEKIWPKDSNYGEFLSSVAENYSARFTIVDNVSVIIFDNEKDYTWFLLKVSV